MPVDANLPVVPHPRPSAGRGTSVNAHEARRGPWPASTWESWRISRKSLADRARRDSCYAVVTRLPAPFSFSWPSRVVGLSAKVARQGWRALLSALVFDGIWLAPPKWAARQVL